MAEERIDSIIDIPAIKKEFEQVLAMINQLGDAIKSTGAPTGAGAFGDSLAQRKAAMKDLQSQTEAMIQADKKLETQIQSTVTTAKEAVGVNERVAAAIKQYTGSLDENIKLQIQYKAQIEDIKQRQKDLEKNFTGTAGAIKNYEERMTSLVRQEQEVKSASQELNTVIRNQVKEVNAAGNSLNELRAQLNQVTAFRNGLDIGSKDFQDAQAKVSALTEKIKALEAAGGDFRRNVGNYTGALQTMQKALEETRQKLDAAKTAEGENGATVQQLTKELELLEQVVGRQNAGFTSLAMEVRQSERALATMFAEGMGGTEAFKEMQLQVAKAKQELVEFNEQQKLFSSQTPVISATTVAVKGLAGAYATGIGAVSLFSDGNEKIEKELNKLVAIMTIMQGLKEVNELLEKRTAIAQIFSTAATKAQTAAMTLYTYVTEGATLATKALRTALISTGIGAIIVLLSSFSDKLGELKEKTEGETGALRDFEAALDDIKDGLKGELDIIDLNLKRDSERVKQRGGNEREIAALTKKSLEDRVAANSKAVFAIIKQEADLQDEIARLSKIGGKEANETIKKLNEDQSKLRAERNKLNEDTVKTDFEMQVNAEKEKTRIADEARKSEKSRREATIVDLEREADAFKATSEDETKSYAQRIAALDAFYKKQKEITSQKTSNDLSQPNLTSGERAKILAEQRKTEESQEREHQKSRTKLIEAEETKRMDIKLKVFEMEKNLEKKRNDDLVKNDELSLNTRLTALQNSTKIEQELIEQQYEVRKKKAKGNADDLFLIDKEKENELLLLALKTNEQITEITKQEAEKQKKAKEDLRQFEVKEANDVNALLNAEASKAYAKDVIALNKSLAEKKISIEEYNKQREKLDEDFAEKSLRNQIKNAKALFDLAIDGSAEKYNLQKQISDLEIQLDDKVTAKKLKNREKLQAAEKKLVDESINLITSLVEGGYDKQKNALQDQIDVIDKNKQADIDRIQSSTLSEQEKADKIKIIEAKAQADKEQLQKKQRELDIKKARFDRDKAIFEIVINTAKAVVEALPNVPLSILMGAIGAAQIAAILAKPIPKFEKGTSSSPEGLAITDEKGPEMYVEPGGKTYLGSDKGPTLRYLKRGTRVIPHDEVNKLMLQSMVKSTADSLSPESDNSTAKAVNGLRDAIYQQTGELSRVYKKQKAPRVNLIVNGDWSAYIRKSVTD